MILRKLAWTMMGSLLAISGAAQPQASAPGTGTVSGHVTCGDTQRPARFAHVVLYAVPAQVTEPRKADPTAGLAEQMATGLSALATVGKANMVNVQTGADGSYVATDVAPGDYYLFATAPGYIAPLNRIQAMAQQGADLKKPLPGVTIVHVASERTSAADIVMDRGAAISGTILWDDGSPLSGATIKVVPAKGDEVQTPLQFGMLAMAGNLLSLVNMSDDEGHFRLSGLPSGEYLVQATIQAGQQMGLGAGMNLSKLAAYKPILVYAPAALHPADAKAVTLRAGEEIRDEVVTLNLSGLHTVSGEVRSAEDRHGINSGMVTLQDSTDKKFVRGASLDASGHYSVTLVPPGTYDLKVADAEDTEPDTEKKKGKANALDGLFGPDEKTIRSYRDGKLSVVVTDKDVTDESVELAVDPNPKSDADFSKMIDDAVGDKSAEK
jgi:hypothetical protein